MNPISMNRLIIGKKGIGKTHFIVNTVLPIFGNYVVCDFLDEYKFYNIPEKNIVRFSRNFGLHLKKEFLNFVNNTRNDTHIVIDNAYCLYTPKFGRCFDNGYDWLFNRMRRRKHTLVFQSQSKLMGCQLKSKTYKEVILFKGMDYDQ